MDLNEFDYHLPSGLIAQKPISPRDACRLMVLNRKNRTIQHQHFFDLGDFLQTGDVLVFNNSKVLPARLLFQKDQKEVELFLLRQIRDGEWLAIGKPGKILREGRSFHIAKNLSFTLVKVLPDGQRHVKFSLQGRAFDQALEQLGLPPFPPYIKTPKATFDDYQTIYAKHPGSVAAPTAGLHFTDRLLKKLYVKGIQCEFVTLHVGLGTFLPVKTHLVEDHIMHQELFHMDAATAERLTKAFREGRRIFAVGTTSVRVLETAFDGKKSFFPGIRDTALYIYPGYEWKCVQGLITNFHLPKSTLLLMVCSFAGQEFVLHAYREAIQKKYRFYSFGDAMLILP